MSLRRSPRYSPADFRVRTSCVRHCPARCQRSGTTTPSLGYGVDLPERQPTPATPNTSVEVTAGAPGRFMLEDPATELPRGPSVDAGLDNRVGQPTGVGEHHLMAARRLEKPVAAEPAGYAW